MVSYEETVFVIHHHALTLAMLKALNTETADLNFIWIDKYSAKNILEFLTLLCRNQLQFMMGRDQEPILTQTKTRVLDFGPFLSLTALAHLGFG